MKRFLIRITLSALIPIIFLGVVYVITDPFKTLRPFSLTNFDDTNRDYISSELFLRNNPVYHYNSFIFGSSRSCGFNTYHWKQYLSPDSRQFLFQAWSETLTGIEQKIDYLDKNGNDIDNVIVLFDIPGTFSRNQLPREVLLIKHYLFSGQSKLAFQACMFYGFIQKPSKWISSIKQGIASENTCFLTDTISNDWGINNKYADFRVKPQRDSLSNCTALTKKAFLKQIEKKTDTDLKKSEPLITESFLHQLKHIKAVFDKHHTNYFIVISPTYCYTNPEINDDDLKKIQDVFGKEKVYDYSGKNEITSDCYNFSDPDHFGLSVGWQIIEDIYNR